jgi:hypothetical protein
MELTKYLQNATKIQDLTCSSEAMLLCLQLLQDVVYGFRYAGLAVLFVVPEFRYREAAASVVLIDLQQCGRPPLLAVPSR